jgi:hypothetical protein
MSRPPRLLAYFRQFTYQPEDRSVAGLSVNAGPPAFGIASEFERCVDLRQEIDVFRTTPERLTQHFVSQTDRQHPNF